MANFDLRNFLTENKLTRVSKTLSEAAKKPTIKILKDLYYFDKLGSLGAKADVDEKYHSGAKLVFKKGKSVADDTTHDDSEYKMITSSKRLEKGVDYEVNESKLTRVSKTLIKENDQNQSSNPKLLAFIDGVDRQAIESYRMLGFKVEVDDPANDQYSAEMDFKGFDWMAVLSVLEDCEREGVEPFMTWNGNEYPFPEAMKLADEKAAEGMASGGMNENLNFSGGEKAAEEFDIDANNGVGIADFLKSMLGHYERIAGEEAVFYELSSEDAAILKMLGFDHLNGEEADM